MYLNEMSFFWSTLRQSRASLELEPQRLATSHLLFHVSQNGIQLCHHLPCIVQAEAHWGFKLQDVPPRAISAQQNVVLLQPVRTGHPFMWPSRPSSAWPWPHVQCSSHTAFRAFHGPVPARTLLVTPTKVLCIWPTAAPAWGALYLVLSLLPHRTGALPHLTTWSHSPSQE